MPSSQKKDLERGILDDCLGFYRRVAQVKVFKVFEDILGEQGITPASFSTLEVLNKNPGITQSKLATAVYLDRSPVVPLLDKLEKRGLITRQASTTDRRHNHLFLTEEGNKAIAEATKGVLKLEVEVAKGLSAAERESLMKLLKKMNAL